MPKFKIHAIKLAKCDLNCDLRAINYLFNLFSVIKMSFLADAVI